jgi:hypothetical protein
MATFFCMVPKHFSVVYPVYRRDGLHARRIPEVLEYWIVGLLDCWITEVVDYWITGLLELIKILMPRAFE